mmetsp:Transcript_105380/g.335425  ORF Transcript_105380/g.335425 Transcript_105380/m.335425 type:complete len:238 (+) Transcript_105380:974-1687(+)
MTGRFFGFGVVEGNDFEGGLVSTCSSESPGGGASCSLGGPGSGAAWTGDGGSGRFFGSKDLANARLGAFGAVGARGTTKDGVLPAGRVREVVRSGRPAAGGRASSLTARDGETVAALAFAAAAPPADGAASESKCCEASSLPSRGGETAASLASAAATPSGGGASSESKRGGATQGCGGGSSGSKSNAGARISWPAAARRSATSPPAAPPGIPPGPGPACTTSSDGPATPRSKGSSG